MDINSASNMQLFNEYRDKLIEKLSKYFEIINPRDGVYVIAGTEWRFHPWSNNNVIGGIIKSNYWEMNPRDLLHFVERTVQKDGTRVSNYGAEFAEIITESGEKKPRLAKEGEYSEPKYRDVIYELSAAEKKQSEIHATERRNRVAIFEERFNRIFAGLASPLAYVDCIPRIEVTTQNLVMVDEPDVALNVSLNPILHELWRKYGTGPDPRILGMLCYLEKYMSVIACDNGFCLIEGDEAEILEAWNRDRTRVYVRFKNGVQHELANLIVFIKRLEIARMYGRHAETAPNVAGMEYKGPTKFPLWSEDYFDNPEPMDDEGARAEFMSILPKSWIPAAIAQRDGRYINLLCWEYEECWEYSTRIMKESPIVKALLRVFPGQ